MRKKKTKQFFLIKRKQERGKSVRFALEQCATFVSLFVRASDFVYDETKRTRNIRFVCRRSLFDIVCRLHAKHLKMFPFEHAE